MMVAYICEILKTSIFPGEGIGYTIQYSEDFPCCSAGKESACNARDLGLIPGLGRYPGEGNSYPLQYSGLENSMDFHGVTRSCTQLCNFHILKTIYILKG